MNNYNFYDYNWYRNMNSNINNMINNNLYNPKDGYEKGNLFSNIYNEYKNYKPATLKPRNEQEKKLYELSAIAFAAHELNLYLDLYPNDESMLMLFNDYQRKAKSLIEEYESMYGPLTISSETNEKTFAWQKDSWPWEVRNV